MNLGQMLLVVAQLSNAVGAVSEVSVQTEDGKWMKITGFGIDEQKQPVILCQPTDEPPTNYYWDERGRFCRLRGSFVNDPTLDCVFVGQQPETLVVGHEFRTSGFVQPDQNGWWEVRKIEPQALTVEAIDAP